MNTKETLRDKLEFHEDVGTFLRKEGYQAQYVKMKCGEIAEVFDSELKDLIKTVEGMKKEERFSDYNLALEHIISKIKELL